MNIPPPPSAEVLNFIRDNLAIARRLAWISTIHREYLEHLEDLARIHNLKI
ncbi:hypothetical protein JIN84_17925 [Luteolibacter yonseiensis]|uniref:Uncharacterized protein n=1 Tax=Luteolibacter yonseiensis TaxID=1144680 RepID=A0A934R9H7_9BACT|nr:hypothetical protein [Luteolibacter yonseiensis]MBK1817504.1 hypothetical protein [Luteolibacter yonseiensis]